MDDDKIAISLEDLQAQFRTFGEGLQMVNNKIDQVEEKVDKLELKVDHLELKVDHLEQKVDKLELKVDHVEHKLDAHIAEDQKEFAKINERFDDNHTEHQQLMQMVKELDNEVQVEIKRVK